ncbi:MAG: hypothetical protein ACK5JT_12325 [Hyphomicrobiaceae bacterium]
MRALILLLVLATAGKVWTQQYIASQGKNEIIIAAYSKAASGACSAAASQRHLKAAFAMSRQRAITLVVGKTSLDVPFWQVDSALWSAKFRNPYLILTANDHDKSFSCEFDIIGNRAEIL